MLFSNGNLFLNNNQTQSADLFFKTNYDKPKNSIKCSHSDKYCAFCFTKNIGPICYNCIYNYKIDIENCIPMKESLDYFIKVYQNHLELIKNKFNDVFNEIISEIEKLETKKIDNIESLVDIVDLKYELPIDVHFEEKLEICLNKKITKIKDDLIEGLKIDNYLNLYNITLKKIKTKNLYPFSNETIDIKSEIPFTLIGIGIPTISKDNQVNLQENLILSYKFETNNPFLYTEKYIPVKLEDKTNKNNISIIRLENPIKIKKGFKYTIEISGLNNCFHFIDEKEEYNSHNKISVEGYEKSIIACLIIE